DLVAAELGPHTRPRRGRAHGGAVVRRAAAVRALLRGRRQQRPRLRLRGARRHRRRRQGHRRLVARRRQLRVRAAARRPLGARDVRRLGQRVCERRLLAAHGRGLGRALAVAARADPRRRRAPVPRSEIALAPARDARAGSMKLVKRTLFALLTLGTLALAAVTAALWLVASERGSAWLVARALARANGVAAVARVEGSLLRGLTLHGVRVRLPQDEVDIERLAVVLDASAALQRIVTLESVT